MALALEKVFLQKVATVVPKEEEICADVVCARVEMSTAAGNNTQRYM